MMEPNPVNLKQDISFPGASEKSRKGKTGKEPEQMMPFACVMGNACRTTTQKTEKILLNSPPGKGKKSEARSQKSEVRSQGSEVGGQRSKMEENQGLLKFSLKNVAAVKGKSTVEHAMTEKNTEKNFFTPVNNGGKNNIGNSLKHLGLKSEAKAVASAKAPWQTLGDEAFKESKGAKVADPVGENLSNGKNHAALFKNGKNIAGINNALFRGQRSEAGGQMSDVRGQKTKMEDAAGFLKSSLKNAVAVKGKSAVEPDKTEKNSFTLTKNDSGKNEIKNILRNSGLKSGETIEILHRKISSPSHSDKIFSAGAYHHTSFHSAGSSAAVNESVNSSGIEPRTLINQIANSVKIPGRVKITLNPPSLGTLDVDVLVRDNKVYVILQAENNNVRHILQSNVESLKSSLRNHGLVADAINVLVQEKSDGANHGADYRSGQSETLFKEGGNRKGNEEDQGREQNSLNHNPSSFEEENPRVRSDGHVSLFA